MDKFGDVEVKIEEPDININTNKSYVAFIEGNVQRFVPEVNNGVSMSTASSLPYKCTRCEFKSCCTSIIFDHQKDVHDNWQEVQCPICFLHCFKEEELKAHMMKHQCSLCDYFCVKLKALNQHYVIAHPDEDRPYTCDICSEKFLSGIYFENHDKTHLSMVPRYQCPLCIYQCEGYNVLKYHFNKVHPGVTKPYNCDECDQKFKSEKYLQLHKEKHAMSECNHKCPLCMYKCLRLKSLGTHIKEEHPGVKRPWSCLECGDAFRFKRYLKAHQKEHAILDHLECPCCAYKCMKYKVLRQHLTIKHTDIKKPYICSVCAEAFKYEHHLRSHESDHATSDHYDCPLCTYKCIRYKLLKPHFVQVHPGIPKPYSCSKCGERFRLAIMLRNHDIIRHSVHIVTHKAMDECTLEHQEQSCSKGYLTKDVSTSTETSSVNEISEPKTLTTNSNSEACELENCGNVAPSLQQRDEPPAVHCYKCTLCEKEYKSYELLQEHMETHDIKLKCKCTTCNYECNDLNEMKEHLNKHLSSKKNTEITHSHCKASKYSVSKKSMKIPCVKKKVKGKYVKRKLVKEQNKLILIETLTEDNYFIEENRAFNDLEKTYIESTRENLVSQVEQTKIPIAKTQSVGEPESTILVKRPVSFPSAKKLRKSHFIGKAFQTYVDDDAINIVLVEESLYQCQLCSYKGNFSNWLLHAKVHNIETTYKCLYCHQMFIDKTVLNLHIKFFHQL